jgi:hypothetical protein
MKTAKGSTNWLTTLTHVNWRLVIVMRRSSCGLGRIEIRSSSEANQFTAFEARSLFPLKSMNRFAAQVEDPITTNRPWEFSLPVLYVPAAPSVSGPFFFF